jgi:hypothetical protein
MLSAYNTKELFMKNLFRSFIAAKRKRRRLALGVALYLLCILRDIEYEEMERHNQILCSFEDDSGADSRCLFLNAEDEWSACEHALGFIDCAIDDLKFAY